MTDDILFEIPEFPNIDDLPPDLKEVLTQVKERQDLLEQALEANHSPGYAAGIAWTDVHGVVKKDGEVKQVRINLTGRSPISVIHALKDLMQGLSFAKTLNMHPFMHTPASKTKTVVKQNSPGPKQAPAPAKKSATNNFTTKKSPLPPPSSDALTEKISSIAITPKPDGRANVDFKQPRKRYPVLYCSNWKYDSILKLFPEGEWIEADFMVANEFQVDLLVSYSLSEKTTTKGNPYKDVYAIEGSRQSYPDNWGEE